MIMYTKTYIHTSKSSPFFIYSSLRQTYKHPPGWDVFGKPRSQPDGLFSKLWSIIYHNIPYTVYAFLGPLFFHSAVSGKSFWNPYSKNCCHRPKQLSFCLYERSLPWAPQTAAASKYHDNCQGLLAWSHPATGTSTDGSLRHIKSAGLPHIEQQKVLRPYKIPQNISKIHGVQINTTGKPHTFQGISISKHYPNISVVSNAFMQSEVKASHHGEKCHFGACDPRPGWLVSPVFFWTLPVIQIGPKKTIGKQKDQSYMTIIQYNSNIHVLHI